MNRLKVIVKEARDLVAADKQGAGTSDPYVVLEYVPVRNKKDKFKTKVIKKTLNPVWNETFDISRPEEGDAFTFSIYDHDLIGKSEFLGSITLYFEAFRSLAVSGKSTEWFNLEKAPQGSLHLGFFFDPPFQPMSAVSGTQPQVPLGGTVVPGMSAQSTQGPMNHLPVIPVTLGKPGFLPILSRDKETHIYVAVPGRNSIEYVTFVTGSELSASLYFVVLEPFIDVRSVWITFRGDTTYSNSKKKIFNTMFNLIPEGSKMRLERGKHTFPFSFLIPQHCPTSTSQSGYSVTYVMSVEADVVNREDESFAKNLRIVNLENTPYGRTPRPLSQTLNKKTLTGKAVAMRVNIPKDFYMPLEDVEISLEVENQAPKKIKKMNVSLYQKTKLGSADSVHTSLLSKQLRLYRPVFPGSSAKNTLIFELPQRVQHSFLAPNVNCEFYLKLVLDVPNAPDLEVTVPINIVLPDPQIILPVSPIDAVAKLAVDPKDWTSSDVVVWLQHKINLPQFVPAFQAFNVNGQEMISLISNLNLRGREGLGLLASSDPGNVEVLHAAIFDLVAQKERVALFLKSIGLARYISAFEEQEITWNVLPLLVERDLETVLPVGIRKLVWHELQKQRF